VEKVTANPQKPGIFLRVFIILTKIIFFLLVVLEFTVAVLILCAPIFLLFLLFNLILSLLIKKAPFAGGTFVNFLFEKVPMTTSRLLDEIVDQIMDTHGGREKRYVEVREEEKDHALTL
jgi:hypothetical protein